MNKKIFCVGLNKTGTTSLHKAFEILGLKSVHYMDDKGNCIADMFPINYLAGDNIIKGFEKYDAFSDWIRPPHVFDIIKEFYKQYPDSKFIVNTRELGSWLNSREKHVKRAQEKKRKNPEAELPWLTIDRDGWDKLCPFLNLPTPAIPFPNENVSLKEKSISQRISCQIKKFFS